LRLQKRIRRILAPDGSSVHKELVKAAAEGQHTTRLKYLLAQGANIDADGEAGLTAFYNAAFRGDLENVQILLASGADVNSFHEIAGTPLCIAALRGHADVVGILLNHKADLSPLTAVIGTAIHCACFSGVVTIVKSMLDRGSKLIAGSPSPRLEKLMALSRRGSRIRPALNIRALSELANTCDAIASIKMINSSLVLGHRAIKCSPIFILVERCHFELLALCWAGYNG
jgi:ankyrin repeat protein